MRTLFFLLFSALAVSGSNGKSVQYEVGDEKFEGYYVAPSSSRGLVVLIHDWDGLTDYEKKRADMLAKEGYSVFAADLFGKGIRPTETKDRQRITKGLYKDREKMRLLMRGALSAAAKQGADTTQAVAAGYCFGGAAVLEFARSDTDLKGFVTFHGGLSTPEGQSYENTEGFVLVFHGTADDHITMDHFAELAKALEENGIPHEMITYGGAPHAFTVFDTDRYRKGADERSWRRFLAFLEDTFK